MSKITRLKNPAPGKIKIFIVASDWHDDHLHEPTFKILIKFAKLLPKNQRNLIINGDFIDYEEFMPNNPNFRKWIKRTDGIEEFFLPAAERGYTWGNKYLDHLQEAFDEIIFIEGNHDWRIENFRKICNPAYAHNFDLPLHLKLKSRGIMHIPYNHWLDIGNISITHGMYHGSTCLKKHSESAKGRSVIFGHIHHDESKCFTSRGDTIKAWSLPAMCSLNPDYLRNRENNWTNGFGILRIKSNGNYNFHTHTIWDDELILESGKILRG